MKHRRGKKTTKRSALALPCNSEKRSPQPEGKKGSGSFPSLTGRSPFQTKSNRNENKPEPMQLANHQANFGRCGTNTSQPHQPCLPPLCSGGGRVLMSVAGIVLVSLLWSAPVQGTGRRGGGEFAARGLVKYARNMRWRFTSEKNCLVSIQCVIRIVSQDPGKTSMVRTQNHAGVNRDLFFCKNNVRVKITNRKPFRFSWRH